MNVLIISAFFILCVSIAITESRYPYEDSYRSGDIVPYANERRRNRDGEGRYPISGTRGRDGYHRPSNRGYPIPGIIGGGLSRDGPYIDYLPSDLNRRRRNRLPPRGLVGSNRNYDNDYDYGRYRRPSGNRGPGFYSNDDNYGRYRKPSRSRGPGLYSNDDFGYGDYSD